MQLHDVSSGPKGQDELGNFQGQDELSRTSWNAHFDKERDRQVAKFLENLTQHQPITNIVSR
jgi:hypothetical protein